MEIQSKPFNTYLFIFWNMIPVVDAMEVGESVVEVEVVEGEVVEGESGKHDRQLLTIMGLN